MRTADLIEGILQLADRLPSGRDDPRVAVKLSHEGEEFDEAIERGDQLGALLEAADCAYYAAKATWRGLMSHRDFDASLAYRSRVAGFTVEQVLVALRVKYTLRARAGNPKNDAEERAAVVAALAGGANDGR